MSMVECPCCHEETEARQLSRCSRCGEYACGECMRDGLCPQCAGEAR
ncbi:MAG: hypothetical protein ACI4L8_07610 [Candidatus Fimadaptatus sp.]